MLTASAATEHGLRFTISNNRERGKHLMTNNIWRWIQVVLSAIGAAMGWFLGEMDGLLTALVALMCVDYITGVAAAWVKRELSSRAGAQGIIKKIMILVLVGVAHIVDAHVIGAGSAIRSAVVLWYISNEGLSVLENAGELGVPWPKKLKDALAQLNDETPPDDHEKEGE